MKSLRLASGYGLHMVEAIVVICGKDINVCIGGGDTAHVGAVALATPRPSLADAERTSASASVLCAVGHKDDELARSTALHLASKFKTNVAVSCGLHIDDAKPEDIKQLLTNCSQLLEQLDELLERSLAK